MKQERIINIFLVISLTFFLCQTFFQNAEDKIITEIKEVIIKPKVLSNWDKLKIAMIEVESGNNDSIIGKADDVGCLQITPIYVKEVNRILGYEHYKLTCRFNRQKSLEMFDILQSYYNPKRDIVKAIKLHNPKAPSSYKEKILTIYASL